MALEHRTEDSLLADSMFLSAAYFWARNTDKGALMRSPFLKKGLLVLSNGIKRFSGMADKKPCRKRFKQQESFKSILMSTQSRGTSRG